MGDARFSSSASRMANQWPENQPGYALGRLNPDRGPQPLVGGAMAAPVDPFILSRQQEKLRTLGGGGQTLGTAGKGTNPK